MQQPPPSLSSNPTSTISKLFTFRIPYTPSFNPQYLSYRHEQTDDESTDTEDFPPSSHSEEEESDIAADEHRSSPIECGENSQSMDDRLTIETCHGLVEYCSK